MGPVEASRALVPVLNGRCFDVVNFVTLRAILTFLKSQAASIAEVCSRSVLPLVTKELVMSGVVIKSDFVFQFYKNENGFD